MTSFVWCRIATVATTALAQADATGVRRADNAAADFWTRVDPWLLSVAMLLGALGLWTLLSRRTRTGRTVGGILALAGFVFLGLTQAGIATTAEAATTADTVRAVFISSLFWLMAGVAVIAGAATITMRSPVYCAVCFAVTLLGVAGLFLLTGAQFLSIATVAVYAGAIVVIFLFVIMLAEPEGHAYYDRISWGRLPPVAAAAAAALLIGGVAYVSKSLSSVTPPVSPNARQVLVDNHMAHLGRELFSVHLLSVEVAGTLLLVALIGAIAIVIQGRDPALRRGEARAARQTAKREASPDRAGARRLQPVGENGRE